MSSNFLPECGDSAVSLAIKRYVRAAEAPLDAPGADEEAAAFVSRNFTSLAGSPLASAFPAVPVGAGGAGVRQPVTVTLFSALAPRSAADGGA